jgi:hypothetical protein
MLATFLGLRSPVAWWGAAVLCAVVAVPATGLSGDGLLTLWVGGPFAAPVYGVFAAVGAAVAAHGLGRTERSLPLWRSTAAVLVAGLALAAVGGGAVAPEGIWPPARYPGHLGFTLWGAVASLVLWGAVRAVLRPGTVLGDAVARAGQRTLVVFAAHFTVKIVLDALGVLNDLDTRAWGIATWIAILAICVATTIPRRSAESR